MQRTSIGIPDDDYQKILAQAAQKSLAVADYLRHLILLGLKVEAAAENHSSDSETENAASLDRAQQNQKNHKKLLCWGLESRYLIRYLIQNGYQQSLEQRNTFLAAAKQKAELQVDAWLKAEDSAPDVEDN